MLTKAQKAVKLKIKYNKTKETCLDCCGRDIGKALTCGNTKCPDYKGYEFWTTTVFKDCCK